MPRKNKGPHVKYRKDRKCWGVVEYQGGKLKRLATGFSCRSEAEEELAEIIAQRQKPSHANVTVGEILAYYTMNHIPTVAKPDNELYFIEKLAPFWGEKILRTIGKSDCLQYCEIRIEEYRQYRHNKGLNPKKISNATLRRELETLQASIRFAWAQGITTHFPPIWKPHKPPSRSRWLTGREAVSLLREAKNAKYAQDYLPLYIILSLYTGQRKQAILSLRWPQVNFKTGKIDFRTSYSTKTKRGSVVPIPARLMRELKEARKRGTDIGYVIQRNQKPIKDIKRGFKTCCEKAGLEGVSPHTLRHTCASWLIQKGFSSRKVAEWIGTTEQIVSNTYGHLAPDHLEDIRKSWG